jgi:uncharacterized protein
MLIEFSIGNYLSVKNKVTLSMVSSRITEMAHNIIKTDDRQLSLLKTAVIYGANASGKSNILKAFGFMKTFVLSSAKETEAKGNIPVIGHLFSTETEGKPSYFEVIFMLNNIRYRYGFEVDTESVRKEWLFSSPKGKERTLFMREEDNIKPGIHFKEGKGIESRTRNNALFLSVVAQFNGELSLNIVKWFLNCNTILKMPGNIIHPLTLDKFINKQLKEKIMTFIKVADLGIEDITTEKVQITADSLPDDMPSQMREQILSGETIQFLSYHKQYNERKEFTKLVPIQFAYESDGTQKYFSISAPIIDTLTNGMILLFDEMDRRLHPLLIHAILKLFNSENNPTSQLIFVTHDTNLLSKKLFRRDQIWFTEKDKYGATDLYSLVEYKVRKDASYEKDYIVGKYGAVPFLGDFVPLLEPQSP